MNAVRWVVLLAVSSGCTAAKAQFQILSAEEGLHGADQAGTAKSAQFEHEMAALYLEKAREKVNYGEYRVATALARQSAVWSDRAVAHASLQRQLEVQPSDFADPVARPMVNDTAPVPEPAPEPEVNPFGDEEDEIEIDLGPKPAPAPAPKAAPAPAPKKAGPKP